MQPIEPHFFKYQSLGNHFILFDWRDTSKYSTNSSILEATTWPERVRMLCDQKRGVGADGVLVLLPTSNAQEKSSNVTMHIFNADGTQAENCLNGLRCAAHHIFSQKNYAKQHNSLIQITIVLAGQRVVCVQENQDIVTYSPSARYHHEASLTLAEQAITGSVVTIGNPHYIIFEKKTLAWLTTYGHALEHHALFPQKTNIECVWQEENSPLYHMIIHERGVGITAACSSGAASLAWLLYTKKNIHQEQTITIQMPGGIVACWITHEEKIALRARAYSPFAGWLQTTIDDEV